MKVNILDAHDRYEHFTKQSFDIGECCQDLVDKEPFGNRPFYIFAHARTHDDGVTKRLIWQPRLKKPEAQTNSMLFKGYPRSDKIKVYWMIPEQSMWSQFKRGNVTESSIVTESIYKFQTDKAGLEAPDEDDYTDAEIDAIYRELSLEAKRVRAKQAVAASGS